MAIFVITEDFLDSKWCKEEQSSLFELICNDKAIVINAMKDNSKLPSMLQSRKYLEWNELDPDRTMKELAAVIKHKV